MAKILIVCGTTEGQTEKIADELGRSLSAKGHHFEFYYGNQAPIGAELAGFDAVLVGSSVHAGKFHPDVQDWVKKNVSKLKEKPSAFFSVCLGILEKNPKTDAAEKKIIDDFLSKTGWHPDLVTIFAGALKYTKYSWLKRQLMKYVAKRAGGDTDTTRDFEYTNWNGVKFFASNFSDFLKTKGDATSKLQATSARS